MPRRSAISNTSTMVCSTNSRSGSAGGLYCPILFIATFHKGRDFHKTTAGPKCWLRAFLKLRNCTLKFRTIRLGESCLHQNRLLEVPEYSAGTSRPFLFKSAHCYFL